MDEKQKMIKELERIVVSLQHHLEMYNEYWKIQSPLPPLVHLKLTP